MVHADSALALSLPAGSKLWSAQVDGKPVRPLQDGTDLLVPISYRQGGRSKIEVVTMERRSPFAGRGQLSLKLPRLDLPVLSHHWRLLLPGKGRYRLVSSDLLPSRPQSTSKAGLAVLGDRPPPRHSADAAGISGVVTDSVGGNLPGVSVELTSAEGSPMQTYTDVHGRYAFVSLAPGRYQLTASLGGFSTFEHGQIEVRRGRRTTADIALSMAIEETITVTSETPVLSRRRTRHLAREEAAGRRRLAFAGAAEAISRELVSGSKPLDVRIPESGKLLSLSGALPPPEVEALIDVRPNR